jgi:DNA-binding response OmpR family regulator
MTPPRLLWIGLNAPSEPMRAALRDHGWVMLRAEPGARACATCARLKPHAVLLAPGPAGAADAVRWLRSLGGRVSPSALTMVLLPALMPIDEVLLLGAGADVVADPALGTLVLMARLRRWLRRGSAMPTLPQVGPLEIDAPHASVRLAGRSLALSASATQLLHELALRKGAPATRTDLARCIGPAGMAVRSRTIDMAISRLRQALRDEGVREVAIESVRGWGYRIVWRPERGVRG